MNWLRVQTALLDTAGALAAFAANWLLQSTLLIAAGLTISWLARRRGAAIQSAIYRTTLGAVIVCPLATLLLSLNGVSGWSLPMPVAWRYVESESPALEAPDKAVAVAPPDASKPDAGEFADAGNAGFDRRAFERMPVEAWRAARTALPPVGAVPLSSAELEPIAAPATPASDAASTSSVRASAVAFEVFAFGFAAIVISLTWIVGATLLVARLALAWRRLHRMLRKASPADTAVQDACQQAAALVGVAAPRVLSSPYITSPCLVAIFCRERPPWRSVWCGLTSSRQSRNAAEGVPYRPTGEQPQLARRSPAVILLPELTPALPLRDVLIHELAHLRRGDAGWNLLARLAEAVFFFQPLVWLLARRLEASAEDVCDDYVVQFGGDRSQYARGLLEIAELSTTPVGATAVAMVSLRSILARRVTRILDSSRTLSTRAGNLLLALVIAGGLAGATVVGFVGLGSHPPAVAEPTPKTTSEAQKPAADEKHLNTRPSATKEESDQKLAEAQSEAPSNQPPETKTFRGQVLDPDGRPFAGATIYAIGHYSSPELKRLPLGESKSGGDGRFELSYPNPIYTPAAQLGRMSGTTQVIAALADGFGPGFISTDALDGKPLTLRLVRDDVPITGRVLDLEGRPVAGVRVSTLNVMSAKGNDLSAWLEAVKRGEVNWQAAKHLEASLPEFESTGAPIVTDAQGRYRVSGIGRERLARLRFTGPNIAYTEVDVVTRPIKPLQMVTRVWDKQTRPLYGANLDLPASPTQPIVGTVRDADTGQPVAGVVVGNNNWLPGIVGNRVVRTATDNAGHYRLEGLPKTDGIELLAVPNDEQPLFMQEVAVPATATLEPVTVDINLHRGIWITGRVTDKGTGRPVAAQVRYLPFLSNEFAKQRVPEFGLENGPGMVHGVGFHDRYVTAADGAYRLVGLPGRAIVGAVCVTRPYRVGVGADTIAGGPDEHGHFPTYHNNFPAGVKWPNSMKEINPPADAGSFACDLQLDPGEAIHVAVVDANGKPLAGYSVVGDKQFSDAAKLWAEAAFDVLNLGPDEVRTVVIRHERLKLGKVVKLRVSERTGRSLTVKLEPCATVKGRVLRAGGDPIAAANVNAVVHPNRDIAAQLPPATTDQEGRFEFTGVPTGCGYDLDVISVGLSASVTRDLQVASGETKDLGDVTVDNGDAVSGGALKKAVVANPQEEKTLRGQVLAPDGRPFAGAMVLVRSEVYDSDDPPLKSTVTDAAGRFELSFRWPEFDERVGAQPDLLVVAAADGLAPDWKQVAKDQPPADVALKLSEEKLIEGRIVNAEGRPLAGVDVRVKTILRYDSDRMKLVLDDFANDRQEILRTSKGWWYGRLANLPAHITTSADGRFRVRGLAANTIAILRARGGGIRDTQFRATPATPDTIRPPRPPAEARYAARASAVLYGRRFDYIAEPGRRLQGTVRDGEMKRPIAKAKVTVYQPTTLGGRGLDVLTAQTDADGRYALDGCAKDERLRLIVEPPSDEAAYLPWRLDFADKPGLGPIEQDVELVKGIELHGRIVDSQTGRPLVADVEYEPIRLNKYAAALYKRRSNLNSRATSKPDGSFRIAVAPGPGAIAVSFPKTASHDYTTVRVGYEEVVKLFEASPSHRDLAHSPDLNEGFPDSLPTELDGGWSLLIQTNGARVALICPEEQQPLDPLEIKLVRGRSLAGRVLDPAGRPLESVTAFRANPHFAWQDLASPDFLVTALAADEKREISFYHAARKLGAFRVVTAADSAPLEVRLEKCVSAVGRVLDEEGAPRAGMHVWFLPAHNPFSLPRLFAVTDAAGRFRTDDIIPGAHYELTRSPRGGALGYLQLTHDKLVFSVGSAKTHDFGDIVVTGPVQMVSESRTAAAANVAQPPSVVSAAKAANGTAAAKPEHVKTPRSNAAARADQTIRGHIIDLEGRPVVGASVRVIGTWQPIAEDGKLDAWINAVREAPDGATFTEAVRTLLREIPLDQAGIKTTATDETGRFAIDAGGAERVVRLRIDGKGVESVFCFAVPRPMAPLRVAGHLPDVAAGMLNPADDVEVFGAELERVVAPGCEVEGIVRDEETDRPMAGVTVLAERRGGDHESLFRATTDAQGHYRLSGISARAQRPSVAAVAPRDAIYIGKSLPAELARPGDRVTVNFSLARGVWLEGRVFDKATGRGVAAMVSYHALVEKNPYINRWGESISAATFKATCCQTDQEGNFRLLVLPGAGLVAASSSGGYARRVGAEKFGEDESLRFGTQPNLRLHECNTIVELEIADKAESFHCEIPLDPGRQRRGTVLGPDGEPLAGARLIAGWKDGWIGDQPLDGAGFTVEQLMPGRRRALVVLHEARKLIGAIEVSGDGDGPLEVRLEPWAGVRGRLVDEEGRPLSGLPLSTSDDLGRVNVGDDGRFELDRMVPRRKYELNVKYGEVIVRAANGITLASGELRDLGDLTLSGAAGAAIKTRAKSSDKQKAAPANVARPPSAVSAVHAPADDIVTVSGSVVDPQSKPVAGAVASVRLLIYDSDDPPLKSTTTDAAGRFKLSFRWPEFDERIGEKPDLLVVATADGRAPDWDFLGKDRPLGEITLKLREERAIAGRVLNSEGEPLAGVELHVAEIARYDADKMKLFLADVEQGRAILHWYKEWAYGPLPGRPTRFTTDRDGRFHVIGLAADEVVKLHVRGAGIRDTEFSATTALRETIRGPASPAGPPFAPRGTAVLYGSQFDYVAEPARRIEGVVRDRSTGQPVRQAEVVCYQPMASRNLHPIETRTDESGRYVLEGCGKEERYNLHVQPPDSAAPYFGADLKVADTPGLGPLVQDVDLARGIQLRGRIVDSQTGRPLIAQIRYAPLYLNKHVAALYARQADLRSHATSAADGSFSIAVAPGPGAVAVSRPDAAPRDYMSVRVSYEDVVKLFESSPTHRELARSPGLKRGLPDSLPTQGPQVGAWGFFSQTEARTMLICPEEATPTEPLEVKLVRGRSLAGQVLDLAGTPVVGVIAYLGTHGIAAEILESAEFTVTGLAPNEKREIAFYHPQSKRGAFRTVSAADTAPLTVRLEKCGIATGRVLDADGAPIQSMHVWFYAAGHNSVTEVFAITDAAGRFRTDELIPGQPYELIRSAPGGPSRFQLTDEKRVFTVAAAQTHDLGDLVVKGRVQTAPRKDKSAAANVAQPPPAAAEVTKLKAAEKAAGDKMREQRNVTIRGRVLLPDGKPAGGAHVAVIGQRTAVGRGGDNDWGHDVLGKADVDENGAYVLRLEGVSQQTHRYATLIARQDGSAIAWKQVNLDAAETELTLELMPAAPLRGRLIDVEGQPAAGVRLSIAWIGARAKDRADGGGTGYRPADHVPPAWIAPVWSDNEGRFVVHGLASEQGVTLQVMGDDRFAQQTITINTGMSEERGETDATYRPLIKNAKPGEEVVLALAPAKIFEGMVRYADSGKAVPRARVSIWASQQEPYGSMISLAGTADEHGHYHITPWAGIRFGLSAYPPQDTPYLARQTPLSEAILWKGGERLKEVDLTLPRGVLVRGSIVDAKTGAPVAGAAVQYHPEASNNPNNTDDILTGWQAIEATDRDGRFSLAVLPGPGRLLVNGQQGKYVFQELGDRELDSGKPGGTRNYAHAFAKLNPKAGDDALEVTLELKPGATVKGRIVDERGNAIEEALVISRLDISPYVLFWRGHTTPTLGGRFELSGLAEGVEYPVYFLDSKRRLGATEIIKAGDNERTVALKPCGEATWRLIDENGAPVPGNYGWTEMVVTPGAAKFDRAARERGELLADADFIANIDRANHPLEAAGDDGRRRLMALIPGATYRVMGKRGGEICVVKEFQVQSKETLDLGEVKVEKE